MNKFIIVDGLPYLYANGKAYAVRWDEEGFTVGAEVEMASVPSVTYSELSIKAKCANNLDSIGKGKPAQEDDSVENQDDAQGEPAQEDDSVADKAIDEMSLAELKEYAKANDIDLNGARTKPTIIEAINKAEKGEA